MTEIGREHQKNRKNADTCTSDISTKNSICTQVHITKKVNYFLMTEEQYFKLQTLEPQFRQEQA